MRDILTSRGAPTTAEEYAILKGAGLCTSRGKDCLGPAIPGLVRCSACTAGKAHAEGAPCSLGCGSVRRPSASYCSTHDLMVDRIGVLEAREWFQAGKVWVPTRSGIRLDARHGDGLLYVYAMKDRPLMVIGIAATERHVEDRHRCHEQQFGPLDVVGIRHFKNGEAARYEAFLKKEMRRYDQFPWVPQGTYKWTEVMSFQAWSDLQGLT